MKLLQKLLVSGITVSLTLAAITLILGHHHEAGILGVVMCVLSAGFFQTTHKLKTFSFTFWVLAFFLASLVSPDVFLSVIGFDQRKLIVPLIQIIMFGMGATLSLNELAVSLRKPKAVIIGMALQFSFMPIIGWMLATTGGFEPEVAAGIILIGSCPGGVASNVMTYIARGNVALSVTMTACSTLVAPFATPLAMKLLAGRLIEINVWTMMISIMNLIIVPVAAGLMAHYFLNSRLNGKIWRITTFLSGILILMVLRSFDAAGSHWYSIAVALIFMACLRQNWVAKGLPLVSMAGICYIIAIIAANSRDQLLNIGLGLMAVALAHNLIGYTAGYFGARSARLSKRDSRTIAIEVGLQNGGMGAALAIDVLKSTSAALGPVVFGTWMNLTGSVLASWWRRSVPPDEVIQSAQDDAVSPI